MRKFFKNLFNKLFNVKKYRYFVKMNNKERIVNFKDSEVSNYSRKPTYRFTRLNNRERYALDLAVRKIYGKDCFWDHLAINTHEIAIFKQVKNPETNKNITIPVKVRLRFQIYKIG